jgi:hypothetical protein
MLRSRIVQTLNVPIKSTGGKVPIRSHVIEASGSSEAWYVPPGPSLAAALPAERRVLARRGWAGENRGLFEHAAGVFL